MLDCPDPLECVISEIGGLKDTMGRRGPSLSVPPIPKLCECCWGSYIRNGSLVEAAEGVPVGVPEGVVFVLSTRDFREPDRGVTLTLRKADTGVERSSLDAATATLGVNGLLLGPLAAAGIRGRGAFCLS